MAYTVEQLRTLFQCKFNFKEWIQFLNNYIGAQTIRQVPEPLEINPSEGQGYYLGQKTTTDNYEIGLFYIKTNSSVSNRRVGLRQLVKPYLRYLVDAALVVFDDGNNWRLSFVCDIKGESTSPKRFTFVFGESGNYYNTAVGRFIDLQNKGVNFNNLKEAFSVEALSLEFYKKLFRWYMWAIDEQTGVTFPNRTDTDQDDREDIQRKMIRLITRLLFVWFIKQKHLVPNKLFNETELQHILRDFNPQSKTDGNYYNAILQNLFFATLNQEIGDRRFIEDKVFRGKSDDYGDKVLYRDNKKQSWFSFAESEKKQKVIALFHSIPYLNGGLFECLDKFDIDPETGKVIPRTYYDGFSTKDTKSPNGNLKYRAFIPNMLFFAPEHKELVDMGDGKRESLEVCGLIEIFRQYNFTTEENTTTDAEVSLDPELLGKVFENLLAAYNPETKDSVRKSTGSYYTPREIVDYMVDESLIAYLTERCGHDPDEIRLLFTDEKTVAPANAKQIADDLRAVKVLDPACGSGAFPMGVLLRVTNIIERLEPENFDRYETKLTLIKNCIYGIDIQPIAMLICKLRFFISLICDSEYRPNDADHNYGIIPLPNLETKFVAANSLLPAKLHEFENDMNNELLGDYELKQMQLHLLELRRTIFDLHTKKQKIANRRQDQELCQQISEYIKRTALQPDEAKIAQWQATIRDSEAALLQCQGERLQRMVSTNLFGEETITVVDLNKQKRNELKSRIRSCQDMIHKELNKCVPKGFAEAVEQVTLWNPYDQNLSAPFFDAKWMFGIGMKADTANSRATKQGGFDIVIGNPPYIKEYVSCEAFDGFRETSPYYMGKMDLWYGFACHGIDLLSPKGVLCFIAQNNWTTSAGARKMRDKIVEDVQILQLLDFNTYMVFDSADIQTMIMLFEKDQTNDSYTFDYRKLEERSDKEDMLALLNKKMRRTLYRVQKFNRTKYTNKLLTFSDNESIFDKIADNKTYLQDDEVAQGIVPNPDVVNNRNKKYLTDKSIQTGEGVFVVNADKFTNPTDEELNYIKPLYEPWQMHRYYMSGATDKNILYITKANWNNDAPRLLVHLEKYKEIMDQRRENRNGRIQFMHLHWARDENFFKCGEKILSVRKCVDYPIFVYFEPEAYVMMAINIIKTSRWNMKFLTGVLNSKLIAFWLRHKGKMQGSNYQVDKEPLQGIPLPIIDRNLQQPIIDLVNTILDKKKENQQTDTSIEESAIDKLVYQLYGLSDDDVKLIEQAN